LKKLQNIVVIKKLKQEFNDYCNGVHMLRIKHIY
jgi:hypothetical protein